MAGTMRIRLSPDLPAMVVEVLSPGLEPVGQVLVRPDDEVKVDVPSEASFIRVRLPSGRSVTLSHPGDLDYVVTPQDIQRGRAAASSGAASPDLGSLRQIRGSHFSDSQLKRSMKRTGGALAGGAFVVGPPQALPRARPRSGPAPYTGQPLANGLQVEWRPTVPGEVSRDGRDVSFSPPSSDRPFDVRLRTLGSSGLALRLPGNVDDAHVRVSKLGTDDYVSVQISTSSELGDTLGSYLSRADYYSAEAMTPWASSAENMLRAKMADPWAATIGAYLLFRLGRYDLMHDWAKNLADWFGTIPDGCVLWAMQSIHERQDGAAARTYLLEAVRRGLPIYTEGLRLLSQGLRRIGPDGERALQKLSRRAGRVLWTAPFTAVFEDEKRVPGLETTYEIGYVAPA